MCCSGPEGPCKVAMSRGQEKPKLHLHMSTIRCMSLCSGSSMYLMGASVNDFGIRFCLPWVMPFDGKWLNAWYYRYRAGFQNHRCIYIRMASCGWGVGDVAGVRVLSRGHFICDSFNCSESVLEYYIESDLQPGQSNGHGNDGVL